jgi:hypothetical protein
MVDLGQFLVIGGDDDEATVIAASARGPEKRLGLDAAGPEP